MSSTKPKSEPIPIVPRQRADSVQSSDSEKLSISSPGRRRFSITEMLGRRTSVSEAYQKYAGFTINGDGFHRENYISKVEVPLTDDSNRERHNQEYFLP